MSICYHNLSEEVLHRHNYLSTKFRHAYTNQKSLKKNKFITSIYITLIHFSLILFLLVVSVPNNNTIYLYLSVQVFYNLPYFSHHSHQNLNLTVIIKSNVIENKIDNSVKLTSKHEKPLIVQVPLPRQKSAEFWSHMCQNPLL
jgi:hypothetical protein